MNNGTLTSSVTSGVTESVEGNDFRQLTTSNKKGTTYQKIAPLIFTL